MDVSTDTKKTSDWMRISEFFGGFFCISSGTVWDDKLNLVLPTTDPDPGPCKVHNANKSWRITTVGDFQFTGSCDVRPVGNLLQKLQRISADVIFLVPPVRVSPY